MKSLLSLLTLGALLASPAVLSAKITRTVEKTFTVQPGGNFKAATQGGDITIRTADVSEVRITAKQVIRASNEQEADEILAKLTLTMEQSGNDVTAEAKYEKRPGGSWFGSWPPVNVSFEVTVPKNFNLNLNTSGGDIEVDRAGGPTQVSTSGGDITINSVAQLLSATTSGGNVYAAITGPLTEDTVLSTSGGDVVVRMKREIGFRLDASTSGGDVDAAGLNITIERGGAGKQRLVGKVNDGGPLLKLRTSGGNIEIRAVPSPHPSRARRRAESPPHPKTPPRSRSALPTARPHCTDASRPRSERIPRGRLPDRGKVPNRPHRSRW